MEILQRQIGIFSINGNINEEVGVIKRKSRREMEKSRRGSRLRGFRERRKRKTSVYPHETRNSIEPLFLVSRDD